MGAFLGGVLGPYASRRIANVWNQYEGIRRAFGSDKVRFNETKVLRDSRSHYYFRRRHTCSRAIFFFYIQWHALRIAHSRKAAWTKLPTFPGPPDPLDAPHDFPPEVPGNLPEVNGVRIGQGSIYLDSEIMTIKQEVSVHHLVEWFRSVCMYQTWRRANPDAPDILDDLRAQLVAVKGSEDAKIKMELPVFSILAVPKLEGGDGVQGTQEAGQ
jgi:hypothetical protein